MRLLAVEHRPRTIQLDGKRGRRHHRQGDDDHRDADRQVAAALGRVGHPAGGEAFAQQQVADCQRVRIDAAQMLLLETPHRRKP